MAAINHIATARDEEFAGRVAMIVFKVAQAVASEDPATAHHAERVDYAYRNIIGQENPKLIAAHVISSNPTIAATIDANPQLKGSDVPDGDIEFALASIWDARSIAFAASGPTT